MGSWANDRRALQFGALVAVVAVLAASAIWLITSGGGRPVTAYFTSAAALFEDNDVRVLGVPVGKIEKITPEGDRVRVDMTITDDDVTLPADVKAAVVSPSLVTGRYVQLTPVYTGGPEWNGEPIPLERTAFPLGVDDLTRTATELSRALGPQGVNANGALNDTLDVAAQNLDGNGRALNDTIRNLGGLSTTLNGSSEDLFGTVTELQKFVATLKENDPGVRELNGKLADVTGFLAGQRGELGGALNELSYALGDVAGFVQDNRGALKSNVDKLANVSQEVVDHQRALAEIADTAPAALGNLANIYNGSSETLDTRANINELAYPLPVAICEILRRGAGALPTEGPQAGAGALCDGLQPILDGAVPLPTPQEIITQLQQGVTPSNPALPQLLPGSPLSLTDPGSQLRAPGAPAPSAPEAPAPEAPAPGSAPPAAPAPTSGPQATPTPVPEPEERGGGLFGGLFGGGS
ncbi:MCE-family protein Mce1D [Pseudonocardia sp. Ae168_Ps1]|uniref:MCE family protein n=1 Tax=unclassified Pseudonocardia TaxID=2619320 RepID=UPI00094AB753|nr:MULTISPECIES: MCE family protein [unclassified Pseudonocardia]OLL74165.1 MCE-family protein Mce1D [Pseudonocardia sp. Ae150A_Ps1]OLL80147.1 MCE-family protein Mce1D [Pseudonocardia sp. Ae168_Ps1]OLL85725.1 MCE-family protein Mce1D [Pseudonocardia sp. Ae263_Ps1]OLL94245.1 MCE-family protein Mce1D [Pseudonocardia sp. Ae356_Ps1]